MFEFLVIVTLITGDVMATKPVPAFPTMEACEEFMNKPEVEAAAKALARQHFPEPMIQSVGARCQSVVTPGQDA